MPERFLRIEKLITNLPAVGSPIATGTYDNGVWWIKFAIDFSHPSAWQVVQMFAHVINYLSISERFSTVFYPVSPPDNGTNPGYDLSWIIETTSSEFSPVELAEWIENRLPEALKSANLSKL